MGKELLDVYSVSHMVGGMILQRMGLSVVVANLLHAFFEFFENFIYVPYFGGRCIKLPPILPIEDCKTNPDSILNMLGDQLSFYIGYKIAEKIPEKKLPYLPSYSLIILPILPLILSLITTNIIGYLPEYEEK